MADLGVSVVVSFIDVQGDPGGSGECPLPCWQPCANLFGRSVTELTSEGSQVRNLPRPPSTTRSDGSLKTGFPPADSCGDGHYA